MRAGACASQQTLSAESASVLKHSLSLARRRGHAQITPLHVAATLLSSRASLLRRACLKSQPHQPSYPLQCRALELCFNVALNRLPAAPGPLLHPQPSLSNALIAALKRAQAHQRRGCIEQQQQQQQPLIAIKVELEQLILSILDDPSVSRVMREAGFSSTSVKSNLEECNSVSSVFQCYNTSGGIYSTPSSPPTETQRSFWHSNLLPYAYEQNPFLLSPQKKPLVNCVKEDIKAVMEVLAGKKRRNAVVLGDCSSMADTLVAELISKVERGDVPDELTSTQLIKFQFSSVPLMFMNKEEVDMNVADLKRKVECSASGGRVIIYIGDLKWAIGGDEREESGAYSPIDHLIAEIGKLLSWYNTSSMRVWLMATANYQTYMKCQMKQPPLDVQWALQPVSVPTAGLGLSLSAASCRDSRIALSENSSPVSDKKLLCLKEEADGLTCCPECMANYEKEAASPQLPYWLKSHSNGSLHKEDLDQLRRKYKTLCQNLHQGSPNPQNSSSVFNSHCFASSYPCWPNKSNIFADSETISFALPSSIKPNQGPSSLARFRRQQSCHIEFSFSNGSSKVGSEGPNLDSLEAKITLALGSSASTDPLRRVDLCEVLKEHVPWQSETIPLIVEALKDYKTANRDKFMLIQGNDVVGKRRLAAAIAESMFGSSELLVSVNMRNKDDENSKREKVERALRDHDKLVVLVENADFADREFQKFLGDGIAAGRVETWGRNRSGSSNVIFILTTGGDYDTRKVINSVIQMKLLVNEGPHTPNLDHKRKAEWDFPTKISKSLRSYDMEEVSSNVLDLNIKAEEDEHEKNSPTFLKKIEDRFVFDEKRAREMFLTKLKRAFHEGNGCNNMSNLDIEEKVLEEVLRGAGLYANSLFEEWLKGVFRTSLRGLYKGEGEKVSFRLCLVGNGEGEGGANDGFMETCLPKRIPVSFIG